MVEATHPVELTMDGCTVAALDILSPALEEIQGTPAGDLGKAMSVLTKQAGF